jgi:hypothetical protein
MRKSCDEMKVKLRINGKARKINNKFKRLLRRSHFKYKAKVRKEMQERYMLGIFDVTEALFPEKINE